MAKPPPEEKSIERLEARPLVRLERERLAWWGGFATGAGGGAFGVAKLAAMLVL